MDSAPEPAASPTPPDAPVVVPRRVPLLLVGALIFTAVVAIAFANRPGAALDRDRSDAPAGSGGPSPSAITPGAGVKIQFSDKPLPLPEFKLVDLDGKPIDQAAWRGKVVLLNFWATWCGPCREEIPALVALQAHYRQQVIVAGLSIDEPETDVKSFLSVFQVNYLVARADEELQLKFGRISAVPATFVVDTEGRLVQRHIGMINPITIEHEIRSLSGLPTDATVERVKDTGQVLLANAAYATEIPGVDLAKLNAKQRETALKALNTEPCTCGCGMTLAACRINDPGCNISLPAAKKLVESIGVGGDFHK
jgi:thiol-disulfide isomerase/thioredoxin